jgi:replicative DNA helicase
MNRKRSTGSPDTPTLNVRPGEVPPPHSPEAETSLLGTILIDQTAFPSALEFLRADDFFMPAHQMIFEAMTRLFEAGQGIDPVTVADALRSRGHLESAGGMARLSNLISDAAPSTSAEFHAKIVKDKALVRRMIATASTIVSEGYAAELEPKEFMDRAEAAFFAAGEARLSGTIQRLDETLDRAMQRIEFRYENRVHTTGIPTGYQHLDNMLMGLQKSDLVIVAARPSMGKTSFALNLALNASRLGTRHHTLFCSLEMSEPQITDRLLTIQSMVESGRIRKGYLAPSELDHLRRVREEMRDIPFYIDDSPKLGVLELRAKARRMAFKGELDLVMVDYLQLMDPTDKRISREQQISEISRSLKALAKELQVPVIALSQLSRAPEQRKGDDRRPILSDLRDSGAIEQDADVVMFLYRPEYYDREKTKEEDRNVLEIIIAKQRNGATGKVRLTFRPDTMTVADREEAPTDD